MLVTCNLCVQLNSGSIKLSDEPCFTQQTVGLTWGTTLRRRPRARLNRGHFWRGLIGQSRSKSYGDPENLPTEHCVPHAAIYFRTDAAATPTWKVMTDNRDQRCEALAGKADTSRDWENAAPCTSHSNGSIHPAALSPLSGRPYRTLQ
jgi:hypothetical protein